ncbi:MAG: NAD(P)-binding domain-containing protein [Microscillaceae bacterium]
MQAKQIKKVCIIGAGSSGIAAAKVLHTHGIPFDCFEKGSAIGGNWRYENDNGMSSAYRSLHINTSRRMMAYSDFPMPDDYPDFPHHSQIIRYFEAYVRHFGLEDKITFNTSVEEVRKESDGTYTVLTDRGHRQPYRAVLVCNGHHWNPRWPEPAFPGTFAGEVLHSHDYKTPDILLNKNVLVVGIGNSAVDIACEAARLHTGRVVISTRSGAYIFPNYLMGKPFDELGKDVPHWLPFWMKRQLLEFSLWLARGRQEDYGVPKPKRKLLAEHPTNSQDLLNLAGRGLVQFKPNIQQLEGRQVLFEDGSRMAFDLLIYCTGYKITFPFFKQKEFLDAVKIEQDNDLQLYRRVVHPDHPGLFFIGLIQPLGAIMPLAELQSQWVAKLLTGEVALPDTEFMRLDIQREAQKVAQRYKASKRHTIQVDFMDYKILIEQEMRRMRSGQLSSRPRMKAAKPQPEASLA